MLSAWLQDTLFVGTLVVPLGAHRGGRGSQRCQGWDGEPCAAEGQEGQNCTPDHRCTLWCSGEQSGELGSVLGLGVTCFLRGISEPCPCWFCSTFSDQN